MAKSFAVSAILRALMLSLGLKWPPADVVYLLQRLGSENDSLLYMDQHDSVPEPLSMSVEVLLTRGAEQAVEPGGRAPR